MAVGYSELFRPCTIDVDGTELGIYPRDSAQVLRHHTFVALS